MKLYEVNREIADLLAQLEPDPETGEITMLTDDILVQLHSLQIERSRILEYLAKVVLDTRAAITALKEEEKRLKTRRALLERKETGLMEILDRECAGEKTDCGVATVCYRKTNRVDIRDSAVVVNWLKAHDYHECYRVPEPEVSKTEVKKLLQSGEEIPGVTLLQDLSCSLR